MRLERLVIQDFRNLEPLDVSTGARFLVVHGPNAQGKTNLLEAIHLLATLKPLRGRRVRDLVRWGASSATVTGWVEHAGLTRQYRVDLGSDGRTALLDGKRASDLQEYFAGIRAITFVPADGRIVSGEPGRRRNWLDRAAFTAQPAHLDRVRTYKRVLEQKSALLRSAHPDPTMLDVLDEQLAHLGAELAERREAMLAELEPHVQELHARIAGGTREIALTYSTAARGDTLVERVGALAERLAAVRERELQRGTTLAGPQLDDVKVALQGHAARTFGSRGQVRSLVLALKLAEMVAARARGEVPLFLIDDVSSELDRARTARLVDVLSELGAQVLATTTEPEHLGRLPPEDTLFLRVEGGRIEPGGARVAGG